MGNGEVIEQITDGFGQPLLDRAIQQVYELILQLPAFLIKFFY
jgi:hypothetical protein